MAWGDEKQVDAVLNDWRTAPIQDKLRATLGFLEKLTLEPERVSAADVAVLRTTGLSDAAIEDAIHACVLFNIYDRLADALDFHVPGPKGFKQSAISLLRRGYQ